VSGPLTDLAAHRTTVLASLSGLVVVLVIFYCTAGTTWLAAVSVFLLGAVGFLMCGPLCRFW